MVTNFAFLVLSTWPLVVYFLFRKHPLQKALVWSMVAGHLLLPAISLMDPPLLPSIDKAFVLSFSAAAMCLFITIGQAKRRKVAALRQGAGTVSRLDSMSMGEEFVIRRGLIILWGLLALMFGATFITVVTNGEPLIQGARFLKGLRIYDAVSVNSTLLIYIVAPFLLGWRYLSTPDSHIVLLKIFVIACLGYTLLAMWELRMSPQLNKQIYGFGPHRWSQAVRGDGYRPIIFMTHGLRLAILFTMSSLAAMVLWRAELKSAGAVRWLIASLYIFVILYLCKSLGALIIAVLLLPVIFLCGVGMQLVLASVIAGSVLVFPLMRGAGLVPTDTIHKMALAIDEKRAHSINYRFENEDILLAHANKKPIAGWGTWGRNRVFNEKGVDIAATDGFWVIVVGIYGWLGYIAQFGLLCLPIILLALNRRRLNISAGTAGLAVVVAGVLIDQIPNATPSPVLWMMAGALMGRYQTAEAVIRETSKRPMAGRRIQPGKPVDHPVTADNARGDGRLNRPLHQRRPREG